MFVLENHNARLEAECEITVNRAKLTAALKVKFDGEVVERIIESEDEAILAHKIANIVHQIAWNVAGDFDSKLLVVNKIRGENKLMLYDRDGTNEKMLDSAPIISTPNVSKDGTKVAYVKHVNGFACIFMCDLQNAQKSAQPVHLSLNRVLALLLLIKQGNLSFVQALRMAALLYIKLI